MEEEVEEDVEEEVEKEVEEVEEVEVEKEKEKRKPTRWKDRSLILRTPHEEFNPGCCMLNLFGNQLITKPGASGYLLYWQLAGSFQNKGKTGLVLPSPFFPGILLSRNLRKPMETDPVFQKRTMVGKNGPGINP